MHFLQAINSDLSVIVVCNKTGGTIKGDIKKYLVVLQDIWLYRDRNGAVLPTGFHKT